MEMLDKSSKPDADDLKLLDSSFGSNTPSREGTPLVSSPQQEADNDQSCEQVEGESNKWTCSPCSCDWKNFVLTACLWWSYVLINGGHSMIGPFFPNEV